MHVNFVRFPQTAIKIFLINLYSNFRGFFVVFFFTKLNVVFYFFMMTELSLADRDHIHRSKRKYTVLMSIFFHFSSQFEWLNFTQGTKM